MILFRVAIRGLFCGVLVVVLDFGGFLVWFVVELCGGMDGGLVAYERVGGLVVDVGDLVVLLVALVGEFCRCFSCLFWLVVFRFLLLFPIGCDGLCG